jgi:lipoyl(octanoyl) transferase
MIEQLLTCQVMTPGTLRYADAWLLQEELVRARSVDDIPDTLLLLEHPHTYTLGTSGHNENVLLSPEQLTERDIEIHHVNRGGDVTYHGPGQLVGYPIIKLAAGADRLHADVVAYVRKLEQVLIHTLSMFGITAYPYPGYTGVWLDQMIDGLMQPAKIAAIGVKVNTRRVTMHGFALNVNTDLSYFKGIIPCGISDKPVTSMESILSAAQYMDAVAIQVADSFGAIMERDMVTAKLTS